MPDETDLTREELLALWDAGDPVEVVNYRVAIGESHFDEPTSSTLHSVVRLTLVQRWPSAANRATYSETSTGSSYVPA